MGLLLLKQSAEEGYAPALLELGELYDNSGKIPSDPALAFANVSAAADLGLPQAVTKLGTLYDKGPSEPPSYPTVESGLFLV